MAIKVQVITEFVLPDITGDGKVDLSDITKLVSLLETATHTTRMQIVKDGQ